MAYGRRYVKDMIKENPDLIRSLPLETQDGDTDNLHRASVTSQLSIDSTIDPYFEQDLTESLLEQIPAFVDDVDVNGLITVLSHSIKNEDVIKGINESKDQKERASKLIKYIGSLGEKSHLYKMFKSLLAGTYPALFRFAVKRLPTREETDYYPSAFQKIMKRKLSEMKTIKNGDGQIGMNNIDKDGRNYVKLQIMKKNETDTTGNGLKGGNNDADSELPEEEIDLTDFVKRGDLVLPKGKKLLIKGRGGVGKTSTSEYLMDLWLNDKWNPDYTLVLLINLRKWIGPKYEKKPMSAMDILMYIGNLSMTDVDRFFISKWLMNWSKHIMLLMDGVDEIEHWTTNLQPTVDISEIDEGSTPVNIFLNILHGNLLPEATVLFTSREFKGLDKIQCYGTAEIRGFNDEGVEAFVKGKYRNMTEDGRRIKKVLRKHHIAKSMCSLPFHCKEICQILQESSSLLSDEIETRTRLTALIITRHAMMNLNKKEGSKQQTLREKMTSPYFLRLAQLAFNGLFHMKKTSSVPKIVFDENDIREAKLSEDDIKMAMEDNILISVEYNDSRNIGPFQFAHHTFQEMFAMALFMGRYSKDSTQRKMVFAELANVTDDRFTMAILFMYGLAYDTKNTYVEQMKKAFVDLDLTDQHEETVQEKKAYKALQKYLKDICKKAKDRQDNHLLLEATAIAHECRSETIVQEVNKEIFTKNTNLVLQDVSIESVDMLGLVSVIRQPVSMKTIHITNAHLDPLAMKVLSQFLAANNTVEELSLRGTGSEGLEWFNTMLTSNESITNLALERNGLTDAHIKTLNTGLSKLKNLRVLSLRFNNITEDGLAILAQSLEKQKQLTELHLDSNDITDEAKKALNKCLANKSKLRVFSLRKNTLSDDSSFELADIILRCKDLERVDLSHNQFGTSGAKVIVKALRRKTHLDLSTNQIAVPELKDVKNVVLFGNTFGERRVQIVTKSIKDGSTFKILNLEGVHLTDERFSAVAESLVANDKLVELKLANNALTRRSLKAINRLAFTCPSLRRIDVSKNYMDKIVIECLRDVVSYTRKGLAELASTDERSLKKAKKTEMVFMKQIDVTFGEKLGVDMTKLDGMRLTVLDLSDAKLTPAQVDYLTGSLESNIGLRKMELANCGLSTGDVGSICQLLCRGTKLLYLGLATNNLKTDAIYYVIQVLGRNSHLRSLNLSTNSIGAMGIALLLEASAKNGTLENLNVSANRIDADHHALFRQALRKRHGLKYLNLGSCCEEEKTASQLVEVIRSQNVLTSLDISNNRIDRRLAKDMGQALKLNETLKVLDLSDNKLGRRGLEALCQGLVENKTLESLKLRKNCLGETGARVLGDVLTSMNIVHLDISENGIGGRGVEAFGLGLKKNKSMTSLNLSNNMIGADGAKYLEAALRGNTTITALNLSSNSILAKGSKSIARLISSKTTKMTCLDMTDNGITDTGVYFIIEGMLEHTKLIELTLTKNDIHQPGAQEIERGLRKDKTLKTLDLSENWLDDEAAERIAVLIKGNKSLTSLNLCDNSISLEGAETLIQALRSGSSLMTLDWTKNSGIRDRANEALHNAFLTSRS